MDPGEDGKVSLEGAAAAVAAVTNAPCALLAAASHAADAVPLPPEVAASSAHRGAGCPLAPTVSLPAPAVAPLQPEADPEFHWGRRQILSLIAKVEDFFEDFYDGTKKKKMIWKAVAERMRGEGHNCTGAECDKKWRNLKVRRRSRALLGPPSLLPLFSPTGNLPPVLHPLQAVASYRFPPPPPPPCQAVLL
ncbi:uncharacterized protein LOC119583743 [Penaeus monodon]|uniref:uncharacterized protein LOC119583743 n=1 Tax=Penaeus monodon TaxID=6687 RepID=UPI0018A7A4DF|nr:uncharacterized protein LOC119583743 [Penaeus monodon]